MLSSATRSTVCSLPFSRPAVRRALKAVPLLATLALVGLACRPGGEAEPAPTASATAEASPVVAAHKSDPEPAAKADGVAASDDKGALANTVAPTVAPTDALPAEPAIADGAPTEADEPDAQDAVPDEPYKVLLLGDSLAATGFGAMLEKKLDDHPNIVCYRKGKSASGLARPDFFDWHAESKRQIKAREPDLVIVILGGNDGQDLVKKRGSKRVHWKNEAWPAAYRERMDTFLEEISAPGRKVMWLGLPHMGLRSFEKKLVLIRQVQREAVEALAPDATYLDTVPYTTNDDGATLATAIVRSRKKPQKLRAEDKIHFTMPGSQYFADRIYPDVLHVLALPDVEPGSDSEK